MTDKNSFVGEFKDLLRDFIEHKQALGFKYTTISGNLRRFSIFTLNYTIKNKVLSKEIVLDWTSKRKSETVRTWEHRSSDLRQFALYLQDLGYEVYIPGKKQKIGRNEYIPYIFTHEEIERFLCVCDRIRPHALTNNHHVLPVLYRLLYCCGLRISEAVNLKVKDLDLVSGIIMIWDSKFGKDRLVPMTDSLTGILRTYHAKIHSTS